MGFIYSILNKENGKIYIGQTIQGKDRFTKHKYELDNRRHHNPHLENAWHKYGEDSFEFNILENCSNEQLDDNENWWIDYFDAENPLKGYNLRSGGKSNFKVSDETRRKLSEINSGENHWNYGKHHSDETRRKISEGMKSVPNPMDNEVVREKVSNTRCITQNTSGYYRVSKHLKSDCKQGFYWRYQWRENGKKKSINSVSLDNLREKVISQGLLWCEVSDFENGMNANGIGSHR